MNTVRGWIPLERCVARPPEGGRAYPLVDHLVEVARRAGDPQGSVDDQLLYLAGLLHDAGKARRSWQERLLDPQRRGPVGPHAFVGAALFAALVLQWNRGPGVQAGAGGTVTPSATLAVDRLLALTRDIADHHGTLADLETDTPWQALWTPGVLDEMDVEGLLRLVRAANLPIAAGRWPRDGAEWGRWVDLARGAWGRAVVRLQRHRQTASLEVRRLLRHHTARLIQADRFSVAGIEPETLLPGEAAAAIERLEASLGAAGSAAGDATGSGATRGIWTCPGLVDTPILGA
ncbi:CRISPR-associated endonuclease Cas3'' [Thermaerobacter sp. PB12/4term]|uniref:CRISPR-associated endonuclease Cas3'' n=1 Tax=Thermaerobacter sp. PB12/4term TaxID=2293838 RepID=UPI000E325E79|nr:CRISPR-associated endonuclease Cas3'' [Thermaerobacter sp. PB12/4term]QIA27432.1 CRISPR-associated endonuclease Cas3'' [Thermaerobacter sp. PB12/4term]